MFILIYWMNQAKGQPFVSQHYKIIIATANWKNKAHLLLFGQNFKAKYTDDTTKILTH